MLVQNFKAITGPHTIPLREQGIIHVMGRNMVSEASDSNGSSKTGLMVSAPCWCFTGRTEEKRRVIDGADVKNRWAKGSLVVEVEYEDGGGTYTLKRERNEKNLEMVKLSGPHGRVWDAKHEIEQVLGFDWSFFTNVVVFGPDTSARFSQAVDTVRKDVLDRIIPDLDRLNRVYERADALLKGYLRMSDEHGQAVSQLEVRLQEARVHEELLAAERQHADELRFEAWLHNMGAQKTLRGQRLELYEQIVDALRRSDRKSQIQPQVEQFVIIVRDLRKLEDAVQEQSLRVTFLGAKVMDNEKQARRLIEQHRCPTCARKFDRKAKQDIIGLARGRDDMTRKEHKSAEQKLSELILRREERERNRAMFEELAKEYDMLTQSGDDLELLREDLRSIDAKLAELEASERPKPVDAVASRMPEYERSAAELEATGKLLAGQVDVASWWMQGLKLKIKSKLLDGVEEYLDERLRHYSSALTAGEITIGFAARTKLKKGTHQDKVSITAEHLFGAAELDLHSSGERQRIDLAIILALQDLARQQHQTQVKLSLFDEVFDHLDETGTERLMELMAAEKQARGTVAIVTQNPRLNAFPADHQVVVTRTKEGTTVTFDEEEV